MTEKEKITVNSKELVSEVKRLIKEGNIRKIRVLNKKDELLLEIPLTVGAPVAAVGIIFAPFLAALGAIAALATECTLEIEKAEEAE